ncbi:hypothetical protein [Bacteroides sp. 224]|uniref:hypothetical protein n=1 Tax=Bacteroides sp. 224 TaxID=2302936 RepID=UPI0013D0AA50|nr:hypothetical protein [Bacteroides sp. 224]NDV63912.1 hypothetical protein [Bacteroides sp. 224]
MMDEKKQIVNTEDEHTVEFKMITDRTVCAIVNDEINQTLIEISGYDLMINFNMEYINSVEDVEAAVSGIADLFRKEIMSKLLEHKKQNS